MIALAFLWPSTWSPGLLFSGARLDLTEQKLSTSHQPQHQADPGRPRRADQPVLLLFG
ncbi:hypothetical protein ACPA9J_32790 [Pseudomonas aeruginosa]